MSKIRSVDNKLVSFFKYHILLDMYDMVNNNVIFNEETKDFISQNKDDDQLLTMICEDAAEKYINDYVNPNYYTALISVIESTVSEYIKSKDNDMEIGD